MVRRIAIIGAGASGLAVLRRFSESKENFEIVCFEQLSNVAGLWNYCNVIADPNHPTGSQYTAVYKNMRTLTPRQIMVFDGCSYPDDLPSFISHVHVKNYLEKYADVFHLRRCIKFNRRVVRVEPKMIVGLGDVWTVKIVDVHTKVEETHEFDIVVVCSGWKNSTPHFPKINGMDEFRGKVIHSQVYRDPEDFKGKRVLLVGGGYSGLDISKEILTYAEKVWLSTPDKNLPISPNIFQLGVITCLTSDSALVTKVYTNNNSNNQHHDDNVDADDEHKDIINDELEPNRELCNRMAPKCRSEKGAQSHEIGPIDVILFCTGYRYSFPFLSADCGVAVLSQASVGPLYKDLVSMSMSSLSFVGLLSDVSTFLVLDYQARFLLAMYEGRVSPPSHRNALEMEREMNRYETVKEAHGVDVKRKPFGIQEFQWYYLAHLAELGGFERPPAYTEDLFRKLFKGGICALLENKTKECKLGSDGFYELV